MLSTPSRCSTTLSYIAAMLTAISIRDIVLVEKLDISLDKGLTVLTGETGAGSPSFWISRVFKSLNLL